MTIVVNGDLREVSNETTLAGLVAGLGLDRAVIAVELNREVVPRVAYAARTLEPGDRIEIVTLVGGG
jgi:thiamine biosynthesis protein ThiS